MVPLPPRNIDDFHRLLKIFMISAFQDPSLPLFCVSGILISLGGPKQEISLRKGKMNINVSGIAISFVIALCISQRAFTFVV